MVFVTETRELQSLVLDQRTLVSGRVQPLVEYKKINEDVSAALAAQMWYLLQELMGLFFDGNLPCSMKRQMI